MWTIRLILLGAFTIFLIFSGFFLRRRSKYQGFLENGLFNFTLVFLYNLFCYLLTGLPSDPRVFVPPSFFAQPGNRVGFSVLGWILIGMAILMMGTAIRQRKTLGGQNVKEGLLTSGMYRYFRHPIYAGVILASLGAALVTSSWDGLLMVPVVLLLNLVQAFIEERYDIGKRFSTQYQEYLQHTRLFGPIWAWLILLELLAVASILHVG